MGAAAAGAVMSEDARRATAAISRERTPLFNTAGIPSSYGARMMPERLEGVNMLRLHLSMV
jgi:hypothetical protein